jgi:RNA 2',3'-cyclic 3'-phosphodiesterase
MTRRLFFALWPRDADRAALARVTEAALAHLKGRIVPAANQHLTLAFLGSVPEERVEEVRAIGREVARRMPADMRIDVDLERLEHWRKAEIVVAEADAPSSAVALARALKDALVAAEFAPDLKRFRAHVTLARKVSRASPGLRMDSLRWSFDSLALVESQTLPSGSLYSVVDSWPLGERGSH